MVVETPSLFFGRYLYKVDIVWCDVIGTYILFVCIHTHM